jgi:hypothetical protein
MVIAMGHLSGQKAKATGKKKERKGTVVLARRRV